MFARGTLMACLALLLLAGAQAKRSGDGTAYSGYREKNKTGFNACQFGELSDRWERYYAALDSADFDDGAHCGKCAKVCGEEGCIVVKIVDECASCSPGDIDLSKDALEAATGYRWDRKPVTWHFISCSASYDGSDKRRLSRRLK